MVPRVVVMDDALVWEKVRRWCLDNFSIADRVRIVGWKGLWLYYGIIKGNEDMVELCESIIGGRKKKIGILNFYTRVEKAIIEVGNELTEIQWDKKPTAAQWLLGGGGGVQWVDKLCELWSKDKTFHPVIGSELANILDRIDREVRKDSTDKDKAEAAFLYSYFTPPISVTNGVSIFSLKNVPSEASASSIIDP